MKGDEILSKSKYFELIKGQHRKKNSVKIHYTIKCQKRYYLPYDVELDDLNRIRKIADPNRNRNPNTKKFVWIYKDHETATKIFMMLMLYGY